MHKYFFNFQYIYQFLLVNTLDSWTQQCQSLSQLNRREETQRFSNNTIFFLLPFPDHQVDIIIAQCSGTRERKIE